MSLTEKQIDASLTANKIDQAFLESLRETALEIEGLQREGAELVKEFNETGRGNVDLDEYNIKTAMGYKYDQEEFLDKIKCLMGGHSLDKLIFKFYYLSEMPELDLDSVIEVVCDAIKRGDILNLEVNFEEAFYEYGDDKPEIKHRRAMDILESLSSDGCNVQICRLKNFFLPTFAGSIIKNREYNDEMLSSFHKALKNGDGPVFWSLDSGNHIFAENEVRKIVESASYLGSQVGYLVLHTSHEYIEYFERMKEDGLFDLLAKTNPGFDVSYFSKEYQTMNEEDSQALYECGEKIMSDEEIQEDEKVYISKRAVAIVVEIFSQTTRSDKISKALRKIQSILKEQGENPLPKCLTRGYGIEPLPVLDKTPEPEKVAGLSNEG
jgi:hypothetical protein